MEVLELPSIGMLKLEWKPTVVVPVGDVQFGSRACSADLFRRWLDRVLEEYKDRRVLFLGMGDYTDSLRPSIRQRLLQSGLDEDEHIGESIEERVMRHHEGFLKLVDGTQGMWLGILEGHHFFDFGYGTTSDTMLAERLNTEFLGDCTMIQLKFWLPSNDTEVFTIWAHHGEGGGNTAGAPLNKIESVTKGFQADAFLMAHQHKAVTTKLPMLYLKRSVGLEDPVLTHYDYSLTCTGGWLQGYMQGSRYGKRAGGNYPEQKMLRPISLGGTRLEIFPEMIDGKPYIYHEVKI